jgi:hypothetical protein
MTVESGDPVVRLPAGSSAIRVQSGRAWVSAAGRDYVVEPGETLQLPRDQYPRLLSPVAGQTVVLEVEHAHRGLSWPRF